MKTRAFLLTLLLLQLCSFASAQRISLKDYTEYMVAKVTVNGNVKADAMIDTGASCSIIDSTFLADSGLQLNLHEFKKAPKLRFPALRNKLRCRYALLDTLDINGLRSTSNVVVANLKPFFQNSSIPSVDILMGSNFIAKDGSRMLTLNIRKGYVEYGRRTIDEKKYAKGILTVDEKGFVGTNAPLKVLSSDMIAVQFSGNFFFDTGNPNYFSLSYNNEKVRNVLKTSGIEPYERTIKGKEWKFVRAVSAEMFGVEVPQYIAHGKSKKNFLIPVTPRLTSRHNYAGTIGCKFLREVELIFDYDNNMLYIR